MPQGDTPKSASDHNAADRYTRENRQRLSAPAVRAFTAIADIWRLSLNERRGALGDPSRSTYSRWTRAAREHRSLVLSADTLTRISVVLGIHQSLGVLSTTEHEACDWLWLPHPASPFDGRRPLDLMVDGTADGLMAVRRFLDGACQGQYMPPNSVDVEFLPYRDDEIIVSGNEQNPLRAEAFASDKDTFAHRLLERRGTVGRDIDLEFSDQQSEPRVAPLSRWLLTHQPAGFAGETVLQLIENGRAREVLEYLDAIRARFFS